MADATADFFDDLSKRGHEPLVGKVRATVRFDIVDGGRTDQWLLAINDGALDVTRGDDARRRLRHHAPTRPTSTWWPADAATRWPPPSAAP